MDTRVSENIYFQSVEKKWNKTFFGLKQPIRDWIESETDGKVIVKKFSVL
jgi:hypothetical protein